MRAESQNTEGDLMTAKEAAAYLKSTPNTVTIWCRAGQLPAIKIGRQWRISKKELDRMLRSRLGQEAQQAYTSAELEGKAWDR